MHEKTGKYCFHLVSTTTTTPSLSTTTSTTTGTVTGWLSGTNGHLNNMFLDPEDPDSIPGEEHGKI